LSLSKSNNNNKRKSPASALELRAQVKARSKEGKTAIQIAKELGKNKNTIYAHIKQLLADGEISANETSYTKQAESFEETRWYNIIARVRDELPFYAKEGLAPALRKMYYRLIELKVIEKSDSNYNTFSAKTAEARRRVDSTYTKPTKLPWLPIDCFIDDGRFALGGTDMNEPSDPTPDYPPDDPINVANEAIQRCKDKILSYDGTCTPGDEGIKPGRWYRQPIYCEILCESKTIQPDLLKFQKDRNVIVGSVRGWTSTPFMYAMCKRLKETAEVYPWIEKIVILYFGDIDKAGTAIRKNVEAALEWYQDKSPNLRIPVPVELRLVAITPEQVKKYRLTGYQIEAFMTTEKRLNVFKKIILDSIDECWNEDIYEENCPDEEYDYEYYGEEQPKDIDPDDLYYDNEGGGYTGQTVRGKMSQMVTEAFKPGWEKEEAV
jgi:hypothetical protein